MNRRFLLLVLFVSLFLIPIAAFSQWQPNGARIVLSAGVSSIQDPVMCADGAGGAIVAWEGNKDILAERINASGVVQWPLISVCADLDYQRVPAICSDGAGGAIIVWEDHRNDPGGFDPDIYAQHINASGVPQWTANGVAICLNAPGQHYPNVISDGAGGAVIAWEDERDDQINFTRALYAQRVNAAGAVQWAANGVRLCFASGGQNFGTTFYTTSQPPLVADGTGGAITAWDDARNGNSNLEIYAQRINGTGATQWTAAGAQVCTATGSQYFPAVASDNAGGIIVTWLDHRATYAYYAQRMNASGLAQWTANGVVVAVNATNTFTPPAIAADGSGGAIVTWIDNHLSASFDVFAQRLNASGATQWLGAGQPVCMAAGAQDHPAIISDGSGGAIVTWEDPRGATDKDVYAQRLSSFGSPLWGVDGMPVCTAVDIQIVPQIATDTAGGAIIAWFDGRDMPTSRAIYAQRATGPNTPAGSNVSATLGNGITTDAIVTFQNVYSAGTTSLTVIPSCSQGLGNFIAVGTTCYDITTNAGYTGNIQTCIHYDDTSLPGPESALRIIHFDASLQQWVDVTTSIDTNTNFICGTTTTLSPFTLGFGSVTGVNPGGTVPAQFALNQNVPNPFNPTTVITYDIPAGGSRVSIGIYDISGRLIRTLLDESRPAGRFAIEWDGRDSKGGAVASGIYFYRMAARDFIETRKMVLLK